MLVLLLLSTTFGAEPGPRSLTLRADWPAASTSVEWRRLAGAGTTLIARERARVGGLTTLAVPPQARVLRLLSEGQAPVSLWIPEGTAPLELAVPRPAPGGEVFGLLPDHAFPPVALELRAKGGRLTTLRPDRHRVFQESGLAPGSYTLTPRYRGGLFAKAQPVLIVAGQTWERVPLVLSEPGAVSLVATPELCDRAQLPARLSLRRMNAVGAMEPLAIADDVLVEPPCDRELEGLEEGTYEAVLARAGERPETLSASRFGVRPGERTPVTLTAPEVRVTGRVTIGPDHPGAGLALLFTRDGHHWRTHADDSGEYEVTLGPAGDYSVSVRTPSDVPAANVVREFRAGEQRADFELGGGSLHVRIVRRDGAALDEAVDLELFARDGRRTSGSWQPGHDDVARLLGLEPGEYGVTARTPSGLASEEGVRAVITPEEPVAEVEVVLTRQDGTLRVVNEEGLPVAGAEVVGREVLPDRGGVVPLRGIPVGEWLRVRADGYFPVCRILQAQDLPEMRVTLPRAAETLVIHVDVQLPWESGLFQDLPGSNCPLTLNELPFSARATDDRVTVVLTVPRGRYRLLLGQIGHSVTVPGSEVHVRAPAFSR